MKGGKILMCRGGLWEGNRGGNGCLKGSRGVLKIVLDEGMW